MYPTYFNYTITFYRKGEKKLKEILNTSVILGSKQHGKVQIISLMLLCVCPKMCYLNLYSVTSLNFWALLLSKKNYPEVYILTLPWNSNIF